MLVDLFELSNHHKDSLLYINYTVYKNLCTCFRLKCAFKLYFTANFLRVFIEIVNGELE